MYDLRYASICVGKCSVPMKLVTGDTLARKEASAGSAVPWTVTSEHLSGHARTQDIKSAVSEEKASTRIERESAGAHSKRARELYAVATGS